MSPVSQNTAASDGPRVHQFSGDVRLNQIVGEVSGWVVQAESVQQVVFTGAPPTQPWESPTRRVAGWDPILLGVHQAIGGQAEPPPFVRRPHDERLAHLLASAHRGVVVVALRGGSSVGKTRSAWEAVRQQLADWNLTFPPDAPALVDVLRSNQVGPRTVLWLNELQNYLDGPSGGLAAAGLLALQARVGPIVVLGTLWPEFWEQYAVRPPAGEQDVFAQARALLNTVVCVDVPEVFTPHELERARAVMTTSAVLRGAVNSATNTGNLAQTLAAAPQLVDRWEHADPYAKAVLNAAIDATHLGVHTPLPASLLCQAASGYCDAKTRATASKDWWERSLAYATAPLNGAISALVPVAAPGGSMGEAAGYVVADYLRQHTIGRILRSRPPTSFWEACLAHITDPDDNYRLCYPAYRRLLYCYVEPFYKRSNGGWHAAEDLADILVKQRRPDEAIDILKPFADGTRWPAPVGDTADRLAYLLAALGRIDELRLRADAGDHQAAGWLAGVLIKQGRMKELKARLDAGRREIILPTYYGYRPEEHGREEEPWAYPGHSSMTLVDALATYGQIEELRALVRSGDKFAGYAAEDLASLLVKQGQTDEAIELLKPLADGRRNGTVGRLAKLLAARGRIDELRALADIDQREVAEQLAQLLAKQGRVDELKSRAKTGDRHATEQLARILVDQEQVQEAIDLLQTSEAPGTWYSQQLLPKLLVEQGKLEELRARANAGHWEAADLLATLLAKRGQMEEAIRLLQPYWNGDYGYRLGNAAERRAELLAEYGFEEELRALADADEWGASEELARLLAKQGRIDELRERTDTGDEPAIGQLTQLLVERRRVKEAIDLALTHFGDVESVVELLAEHGQVDEADRLQRFGLTPDGHIASVPAKP